LGLDYATPLAQIAAASPDLEKQSFFQAVVFIYREYSG
tara:strand:+ start:1478 stop:1591 length:114 start_codon:yes stop_codon:yes gene_type:complete